MPTSLGRLRHEVADFAAVLAVWLLFTFTVGSAVTGVIELAAAVGAESLQTPLVVAAVATAVPELLDCRPTLRRTAAFAVVDLLATLGVVIPVAMLTHDAPATLALLDLAVTAIAAWVVFAGGYERVTAIGRTVLSRLTRQPPAER